MRWDYDVAISSYISDKLQHKNTDAINKALKDFDIEIGKQKQIIIEQQKQTINIEETFQILTIFDLGIEDFKIKPHSDNLYKIVREKNDNRIFKSLSRGY